MWLTNNNNGIKFELSKKEAERYRDFKSKVTEIKASELQTRQTADLDDDYYSKRTKLTDFAISLSFVEGSIGHTVYVSCDTLGLKEDITDHDTW